jgi:hypothetical protein
MVNPARLAAESKRSGVTALSNGYRFRAFLADPLCFTALAFVFAAGLARLESRLAADPASSWLIIARQLLLRRIWR